MDKWTCILIVACCTVPAIFLNLAEMKKDPIAQQIDACKKACSETSMKNYDSEKKQCTCTDKE